MNTYVIEKPRENIPSKLRILLQKYEAVVLPKDRQRDRTRILFQSEELKKRACRRVDGFDYTHTEAPAIATFKDFADVVWELEMLG